MESGIHDLINILEVIPNPIRDHHVGNLLPLFSAIEEELWTQNNNAHWPAISSKTQTVTTPLTQLAFNIGPLSARQRNAIRMAFRWRVDTINGFVDKRDFLISSTVNI